MQFSRLELDERGIIFCNTKAATKKLSQQLIAKNFATDTIYNALMQKERDKVMRAFKNESLRLLLAEIQQPAASIFQTWVLFSTINYPKMMNTTRTAVAEPQAPAKKGFHSALPTITKWRRFAIKNAAGELSLKRRNARDLGWKSISRFSLK